MKEPTERELLEGLRPEDEWEHERQRTLYRLTADGEGGGEALSVPEVVGWLRDQGTGEVMEAVEDLVAHEVRLIAPVVSAVGFYLVIPLVGVPEKESGE